ncbi:hypothetical protein Indivirus_1_196 [Indivirus ILV1]|uniref:Uncharacterized protein n=1 Tax=Indivirus ILV1 TaxID=1977633 RepID=A0A1V0SCY1_9VIRU|nr:hypothetical protein Indivirus_1_196 [Indivirus ILV1]
MDQEHPQTQPQYVQQLYLGMADFKPYYYLSKASIGQIMICFQNILSVIPKSEYESKLYSVIIPEINQLVQQYNNMLVFKNYPEMLVRYYSLLTKLPSNISIYKEEHNYIQLKNPKIGALIKAAKQRLYFVITREVPDIYKINSSLSNEFNNLKDDCQKFYESMINFEKIFIQAVRNAK